MWNHVKELKNRNYDEINIKLEKESRRKKSEKIETFFWHGENRNYDEIKIGVTVGIKRGRNK